MEKFDTKKLSHNLNYSAPDGSEIRLLLKLQGGRMPHFKLQASKISTAVTH